MHNEGEGVLVQVLSTFVRVTRERRYSPKVNAQEIVLKTHNKPLRQIRQRLSVKLFHRGGGGGGGG